MALFKGEQGIFKYLTVKDRLSKLEKYIADFQVALHASIIYSVTN